MSEAARETSCDWTVTGMDCGSCATKIKDAVARLPGVSGVEVGIMSERLRLTLDEGQTAKDRIEKTVIPSPLPPGVDDRSHKGNGRPALR